MQQNTINCTHYLSTFQIFLTFIICGESFPHDNLSCGEFLHLTVCHVDKFLHMKDFFSMGTARCARDKYEVWSCKGKSVSKQFSIKDNLVAAEGYELPFVFFVPAIFLLQFSLNLSRKIGG